jgi:phage protein D
MSGAAFRMFFGTRPATIEELARVEQIIVEQEMEMAWEARLKMSICLDDLGHWRNQPSEFAMPFSRIRIEVQVGEGAFMPLIDGPVAGFATEMSSNPGVSAVNILVRDDSVLLNREEGTETFENQTDSDLVTQMFSGATGTRIAPSQVTPTTQVHATTVKRGTAMQFIRELARANGFLGYVLPGEEPGQSIGCFRERETGEPSLPPLILLGEGRNLIDAEFEDNSEGAETTRARTLRISDQQIVSAEQRHQDETLLGDLPAVSGDDAALREVPPEEATREDPAAQVASQNRNAAYSVKMNARVVPGCYEGVLAPYRTVTVRAGDTPYSGVWLIRRVTHRVTPSIYTQELEARRNALSATESGALSAISGVF